MQPCPDEAIIFHRHFTKYDWIYTKDAIQQLTSISSLIFFYDSSGLVCPVKLPTNILQVMKVQGLQHSYVTIIRAANSQESTNNIQWLVSSLKKCVQKEHKRRHLEEWKSMGSSDVLDPTEVCCVDKNNWNIKVSSFMFHSKIKSNRFGCGTTWVNKL